MSDSHAPAADRSAPFRRAWPLVGFIVLIWAALYAIRLLGPPDLMERDRDQEKPSAYVVDCIRNGHWLCQRDHFDNVTSKPPLYTWLAAGATLALGGEISRLSMTLPCALSVLATTLLAFYAGRRWFGPGAGLWAALCYLWNPQTYRLLGLIRTDPLFTALIFASMLLAFSAWTRGSSLRWFAFWVVSAASNMTKGPLGFVLALLGLFAAPWERRWRRRRPSEAAEAEEAGVPGRLPLLCNWGHVLGLMFCLGVAAAWVALSIGGEGQDFIDRIFKRELVGHAVGGKPRGLSLRPIRPIFYVLSRYIPWSVLSYYALWRLWKRPAAGVWERLFERFIASQFAAGLVLFCLVTHKRMELYHPLLPAAALLAGREMRRLLPVKRPRRYGAALGAAAVGVCAVFAGLEYIGRTDSPEKTRLRAITRLAQEVETDLGAEFPFTHFYTPYAFQFPLNTMRPYPQPGDVYRLLAGEEAAFVTVDRAAAMTQIGAWLFNGPTLYEVARAGEPGYDYFRVLSNHPRLEWTDRMALVANHMYIRMAHVRLESAQAAEFQFRALEPGAWVTLENVSDRTRRFRARLTGCGREQRCDQELAPGGVARLAWGGAICEIPGLRGCGT